MANVPQNLNMVRDKMRNSCLKRAVVSLKNSRLRVVLGTAHALFELQNREPRLVAVSKLHKKELIVEAYKCGQRHFGENYVNELFEKSTDEEITQTCPDIQWHFIGHLQRNKVGKLLTVPNLFIVESVDSEKLAEALNTGVLKAHPKGDRKVNIFIQVNTSGEESKSGCTSDEVVNVVKYVIDNCKNLNVTGLMTIGKYDNYNSQDEINPDFECLIKCRAKVCKELNLDINNFDLSMGMSGDFEHAIEVGATNVRVGSLIFGERPFSIKKK